MSVFIGHQEEDQENRDGDGHGIASSYHSRSIKEFRCRGLTGRRRVFITMFI